MAEAEAEDTEEAHTEEVEEDLEALLRAALAEAAEDLEAKGGSRRSFPQSTGTLRSCRGSRRTSTASTLRLRA